jgi:NAD(P)H-nitrite reductase large subunit
MLHKYLGNERNVEDINFISELFFEEMNIKWLNNTMVESLDTEKKLVFTDKNEEISYDQLLLATGASYFIPPIPGLRESSNVYGFRDLKDAQLIDEACKTAENAVIIGQV